MTELDVRELRKPDKHPTIFAAFDGLPAGGSFVVVNNHDPRHLHDEFETEHPGGYDWEYVESGPRTWRIRISKLTNAPLPRVLVDTATLDVSRTDPDASGALWKLEARDRDLDSNVVALPPGGTIDAHEGPDLDVIVHVLSGSGELGREQGALDLRPGVLVWLPKRSQRSFTAGPDGLRYLTVHRKRQALKLRPLH